ncbi:hypothetical protein, partial [Nocardia farcinica]|uniref:hypothetical protein n=1 Tax=Nocardia farcinica TaxID=37329 RepID=UPI002458BBEE
PRPPGGLRPAGRVVGLAVQNRPPAGGGGGGGGGGRGGGGAVLRGGVCRCPTLKERMPVVRR